jgi:hypothetical protein
MIRPSLFVLKTLVVVVLLGAGSPQARAQLNAIAFCADDPSMGVFEGVGVSAPTCSSDSALSQAKSLAIGFASGFATGGCVRFSAARCTSICQMSGATRLAGPEAHGATFSSTLQDMKGFSADRVLMLNRGNGFCARVRFMDGSASYTGPDACINAPFNWPLRRPKYQATAKADSFCGCVCH